MYSTVRPLGMAATRCTWISGTRWLTTGRLNASAIPATFIPLRDAAHAQQIDHHDVDRARFQQMAEGHDAVVVLAGGDRRGQRISHAGEPRVVVVGNGVLQPI